MVAVRIDVDAMHAMLLLSMNCDGPAHLEAQEGSEDVRDLPLGDVGGEPVDADHVGRDAGRDWAQWGCSGG